MNRTDRLYALVEELRAVAPRPRSARWLATRFEVSTRTVERDISALQQSGVPIWVSLGRSGGYALDRSHTLPPLNMTPAEAVAIAVALHRLDGTPFHHAARAALHKLLAVMPAADVRRAEDLAARIHLVQGADPGPAPFSRAATGGSPAGFPSRGACSGGASSTGVSSGGASCTGVMSGGASSTGVMSGGASSAGALSGKAAAAGASSGGASAGALPDGASFADAPFADACFSGAPPASVPSTGAPSDRACSTGAPSDRASSTGAPSAPGTSPAGASPDNVPSGDVSSGHASFTGTSSTRASSASATSVSATSVSATSVSATSVSATSVSATSVSASPTGATSGGASSTGATSGGASSTGASSAGLSPAIVEAFTTGRVLDIAYADRFGVTTRRHIEPAGYLGGPAGWYLLAWCRLRGGLRSFRVDRIHEVVPTAELAARRPLPDCALDIPGHLVRRLAMAA
ncbi:helix-turn-helix transcriptional regulator [Dactylosporangium aurantiacum]|uniref:helix-turn-helix transcriptional regulator n=1 Tax=Dactylosporangium aurantiacum TaxID=35754 RepID=UPI003690467D